MNKLYNNLFLLCHFNSSFNILNFPNDFCNVNTYNYYRNISENTKSQITVTFAIGVKQEGG